jgi:hypothetical protein
MQNHKITQFIEPDTLQSIGAIRLNLLFQKFAGPLNTANLHLPSPDPERPETFTQLATALKTHALPPEFHQTLRAIETAAAPENADWLEDTRLRRIPCISIPALKLDVALEIFFAAPDELDRFKPASDARSSGFSQSDSVAPTPSSALSPPSSGAPSSIGSAKDSPTDHSQFAIPRSPSALSLPSSNAPSSALCPPSVLSPPPPRNSALPPKLRFPALDPWPEPVNAKALLDAIKQLLQRYVVLPRWVAETVSLWIVHTYAFELRDITTYLGIESPTRRCGKTTLLTLLHDLANRPVVAASVSSPSFFRAIEELRPTLMIDEADRFLKGKSELQGILNAGYCRKTAFVLRVGQQLPASDSNDPNAAPAGSSLAFFSCWCPKVISQIGRLSDTLADRCIVFRMQRKTPNEECERMRNLDTIDLKRQCIRFVADNSEKIANASPEIPDALNDRAADIWEPLFALADIAGEDWPQLAREAAEGLSKDPHDGNAMGSLLLDIFVIFIESGSEKLFTFEILDWLNHRLHRPWAESRNGREVTDLWLAKQLRPYDIKSRNIRIGENQAKGYHQADFMDAFRRYIPSSETDALREELASRVKPKPEESPSSGLS